MGRHTTPPAPRGGRDRSTAPSRWCSPASTAASREGSSSASPAACRSPRRSATRSCSRTSSTARRFRHSTVFRSALVVPGWYGMTNVKWLERITRSTGLSPATSKAELSRALQERTNRASRSRGSQPRALMVPPGIPEFLARADGRPGACRSRVAPGRAGARSRGSTSARRRRELGRGRARRAAERPWAWTPWGFIWEPARRALRAPCRAHRRDGNVQPLEPPWNLGGYANNAVQRVVVTVRGPPDGPGLTAYVSAERRRDERRRTRMTDVEISGVTTGRRTKPPFRADHVGSLLRPPQLLQARKDSRRDGSTPRRCAGSRTRRSARSY